MQKIKNALSGNDSNHEKTASGRSGDDLQYNNTDNENTPIGERSERTEERLTGDRSHVSGLSNDRSAVGSDSRGVTGAGGQSAGLTGAFDGHAASHDNSMANEFDPSSAHHDHKHLGHVTHRDVHHTEVEEVERQREHDRHVHHVQHHVQPVQHKEVRDEVHHEQVHPVTHINEKHVNTDEDHKLLAGLGSKHKDEETHRAKERTIIDKGETVTENVHHHVHHVTQPVVQSEVHDRHRIHTVIPTKHTTHEAPIVHKSSVHEPIGIDEFKKGGGVLGSEHTLDNANVLSTGNCERNVDGVGEKLAEKLHLGKTSSSNTTGATHSGSTATTGNVDPSRTH